MKKKQKKSKKKSKTKKKNKVNKDKRKINNKGMVLKDLQNLFRQLTQTKGEKYNIV